MQPLSFPLFRLSPILDSYCLGLRASLPRGSANEFLLMHTREDAIRRVWQRARLSLSPLQTDARRTDLND